jgi:poly-gamma-glutamate synthesis protein (capsule biosynthesis protein)
VSTSDAPPFTILLAGDVMTGRGVDQIMPHPSSPELRERWADAATDYVELAARAHGPIPAPVDPSYVWGDALGVLQREQPVASIVNLETSITVSDDFWPGKAIHYRMHPDNVACLRAAHIDVCVLANNHVLDFGVRGLLETLDVLRDAGIDGVGAGRDLPQACRPARVDLGHGASLWVLAFGSTSSGIPREWAATRSRPGIRLLDDLSTRTADEIITQARTSRGPGDLVIASIHWGSNWGYDVGPEQVAFAHRLVDGGIDLVHGHSSHHVRPIEVHRGRLVLYGCGDLVSDYEGIRGHEQWRSDIGAMHLATISPAGPSRLRMIPTRMRRMQLARAEPADATWLRDTVNAISRRFGARFELAEDGALMLAEQGADRATR